MQIELVKQEIELFWTDVSISFDGGGDSEMNRLQAQFALTFPDALKKYVRDMLPPYSFHLESYGTYKTLYGFRKLSSQQDGYSWNPLTQSPIQEWSPEWLLIGDEEADPFILDLSRCKEKENASPIFRADHGAGNWKFHKVSSSLPQFLICAACVHHALTQLTTHDPIYQRKRWFGSTKFRLNDEVADWLLPRIKRYDEEFYDYWVGIFENS